MDRCHNAPSGNRSSVTENSERSQDATEASASAGTSSPHEETRARRRSGGRRGSAPRDRLRLRRRLRPALLGADRGPRADHPDLDADRRRDPGRSGAAEHRRGSGLGVRGLDTPLFDLGGIGGGRLGGSGADDPVRGRDHGAARPARAPPGALGGSGHLLRGGRGGGDHPDRPDRQRRRPLRRGPPREPARLSERHSDAVRVRLLAPDRIRRGARPEHSRAGSLVRDRRSLARARLPHPVAGGRHRAGLRGRGHHGDRSGSAAPDPLRPRGRGGRGDLLRSAARPLPRLPGRPAGHGFRRPQREHRPSRPHLRRARSSACSPLCSTMGCGDRPPETPPAGSRSTVSRHSAPSQ